MYALEIEQLRKTYAGGFEALKGISLQVKKGDFYALLGPNGAGKSTTIGIISSLVNKTSGTTKVFGYDIDTDLELAKQNLGLVPQEFNFNQFETVEQIVMQQAGYYGVSKVLAKERAEKYLKKLDLWEKRKERARNLSGGMKRRLMIARALMHEPQLLILDEPTNGLDPNGIKEMRELIKSLSAQDKTILVSSSGQATWWPWLKAQYQLSDAQVRPYTFALIWCSGFGSVERYTFTHQNVSFAKRVESLYESPDPL